MTKTQITPDLKDWIINTLKSGVSPVAIANALVKKGFDARFAYESLFEIVGGEAIRTSETRTTSYNHEIPEIGRKGNLIKTNARDIKVLARLEKPFVLHLDNVLSPEECDQLISLSKNRLKPSRVVDPKTGEEKVAAGRTSKGMHFGIKENELVLAIEERIAELTNFPIENGEGLQVLNYGANEEYKPHFDYFSTNMVEESKGGQRIGTFLIYLNDVSMGGETVFPKVGLSIVPKKGTALYFHYGNSKGQVDRMSLHSSVPVIQGEKWVATKWIREGKIYN